MGYDETLCIKRGHKDHFCTTQVNKLNNLSSIKVETNRFLHILNIL